MYERSAIVLERYFDNLFGFNKPNNLVQNYKNYCELFEKFDSFQNANSEEFKALEEFQAAEVAIEDIQTQEEKLYKKNAKYEYNRDLVFNDISQKPDEIEKCMLKLEGDISKTQNSLVTLREKFVEAVRNYNDKKSALSKAKKNRKNAESDYNKIFELTKQNIENISEEFITAAKTFSQEEGQEDLINTMIENGKDEKIPFNNLVVRNAVKVGFDIQKRFVEAYIEAYNKANKLLNELLEGAVSVELHQKVIRNINVKLNFLNAEKDYLVQFLDYERIMVIHGKRTHRNLMLEACENFNIDVSQIDNLYELLLKEISNKSTKKAYKELYNKSYLVDIEENDEKFKKEKNKINLSTATVMNTNYWRIEGIKNIYTVFYKDVVGVFGKDLDEFDVPKAPEEDVEETALKEEVDENIVEVEAEAKEEIVETIQEETVERIEEISNEIIVEEKIPEEKTKKASAKTTKKEKTAKKKSSKKENIQVAENVKEENVEGENKSEETVDWDAILDVFDEIEMDLPETKSIEPIQKEKQVIEKIEEISSTPIIEDVSDKKVKKVKRYTRKKVSKENVVLSESIENDDISIKEELNIEDIFNEIEVESEEPDIFGERFRDIEKQIAELEDIENFEEATEENRLSIIAEREYAFYEDIVAEWQKEDGWKVDEGVLDTIDFHHILTQQAETQKDATETQEDTQGTEEVETTENE